MSLQYAILGLLNYDSMTGYDIKKMFDESINNFWAASISQIYRELGTLESKGYLTYTIQPQNDRPDKKIYSITDAGKTAFKEWIIDIPQKLSKETRDEFTLRIFFGSNLSKEELIGMFQGFIREKRENLEEVKNLYQVAEQYSKQMKLFNGEEIYWKFILKRVCKTQQMLIDWANECIDELNKQNGSVENE
ncbi:MAG: PadR family transcriptional regulator [Caulobacteraceae bacterium]